MKTCHGRSRKRRVEANGRGGGEACGPRCSTMSASANVITDCVARESTIGMASARRTRKLAVATAPGVDIAAREP